MRRAMIWAILRSLVLRPLPMDRCSSLVRPQPPVPLATSRCTARCPSDSTPSNDATDQCAQGARGEPLVSGPLLEGGQLDRAADVPAFTTAGAASYRAGDDQSGARSAYLALVAPLLSTCS